MLLKTRRGTSAANLQEQWFQTTTSISMTSPASKNHQKKTCCNQPKLSKIIKLSLAQTTKTVKALANGTD